jgi:hypothetical protein
LTGKPLGLNCDMAPTETAQRRHTRSPNGPMRQILDHCRTPGHVRYPLTIHSTHHCRLIIGDTCWGPGNDAAICSAFLSPGSHALTFSFWRKGGIWTRPRADDCTSEALELAPPPPSPIFWCSTSCRFPCRFDSTRSDPSCTLLLCAAPSALANPNHLSWCVQVELSKMPPVCWAEREPCLLTCAVSIALSSSVFHLSGRRASIRVGIFVPFEVELEQKEL